MKKKILSLLLAVVMVFGMVAMTACTKAPPEDTKPDETTTAPADETKAPETEDDKDLDVVTILCWSQNSNANPAYRYSENPRWEKIPMVAKLYEKFAEAGVRLEYEVIDNEQYNDSVKTRLMTGVDLPDIIANPGMSEVEAVNAGEAGIVADVKALCDQYDEDGSIMKYWQDMVGASITEITTEDGNIWWMPYTYHRDYLNDDGTVNPDHYDVSFHVSVRRDWMDALGIEFSMFYTPDEFADLLIELNEKDANGNGIKDEVIGNLDTKFYTGFESGFGMGQGLVYVLNDGKGVQCNLYNENFKTYVEFLQKLYKAGCIDTTVLNGTNVKSANRASTIASYGGQTWEEAAVTGYEATAIYSPVILDDDKGENGYAVYSRDNKQMVLGKWFINANSPNLDAVMRVFDVLYTDEVAHMMTWGEEGLTYELDENGNKIVYVNPGEDGEYNIAHNTCRGMVGNNGLPNVYDCRETRTGYLATQKHLEKYADKDAMIAYVYDHDDKCTFQESILPLAMVSNDERAKIEQYQTTIETYVDEMMLGLITGEKSLDDYDTYLAELEALGLKEYISVYEGRHARWVAYANENNLDTLYN